MKDMDQEMLNDLIVESRDHLVAIEPDLLALERDGASVSDDLINRVFRAVHSIKGGFGFFGLEKIVTLSHAMENVLSRIRDKQLAVSSKLTDALLLGVDALRVMLDDVGASEEQSIEQEMENLRPFMTEAGSASQTTEPRENEPSVPEGLRERHAELGEALYDEAVKSGKYLYHIGIDDTTPIPEEVKTFKDLFALWEKFCEIVAVQPEREKLEMRKTIPGGKGDISVIVASVLEPDLIGEALNLAQEHILTIDLTSRREAYRKKFQEITQAAEQKETSQRNENIRGGAVLEEALRVKVSLLNNLMNYAGELVLARNQLLQLLSRKLNEFGETQKAIQQSAEACRSAMGNASGEQQKEIAQTMENLQKRLQDSFGFALSDMQGINGIVQNVDRVTSVLQENIMQTRMQPLSVVFNKFPRVVRDLARKMEKEIELVQIGQEVELDKSIIEMLSDPLTHLVRNSVDHGVETPQLRQKAGKKRAGTVTLRAFQQGGKVIIQIGDDGAGIDPDRVKASAIEKGIVTPDAAAAMSTRELQMLIFSPGFSTAAAVSDISGRGVGMDVVKTNIERLGGTVEVDSEIGIGSTITMKLPLTLAIIPSLIVTAEGRRFAVPQVGLEEIVRIRARDIAEKIERIQNSEVLRLRGKLLPLVRLADVLGLEPTFVDPKTGERKLDRRNRWSDRRGTPSGQEPARDIAEKRTGKADRRENVQNAVRIVVLRTERNLYGLVVDDVQDSEEIVVKPLPSFLKDSGCYSGATIMGDGRVAMIIDANGIAQRTALRFSDLENEAALEHERARKEQKRDLTSMLFFSIGGSERFGVELSSVARIVKRRADEIEKIGNREFLKQDDKPLRLFRLENYLPVQPPASSPEQVFVLVPKNTEQPLGIVTSRVEDTMDTELQLDTQSVSGTGIRGSAIVGERMTVVLDVPSLLQSFLGDLN